MLIIWTSDECCEQIKQWQEEKKRKELKAQIRRNKTKKKKDINDIVDMKYKVTKTYHAHEVVKWMTKCTQWEEEGLLRAY